MAKLQLIRMDDGSEIYVEASEDLIAPMAGEETGETTRTAKGIFPKTEQIAQNFKAIEGTIRTYTKYTLDAFRDASLAEVKKVTLEFGVNVSGIGGVPYIATGTAGCNLKVVVECAFSEEEEASHG